MLLLISLVKGYPGGRRGRTVASSHTKETFHKNRFIFYPTAMGFRMIFFQGVGGQWPPSLPMPMLTACNFHEIVLFESQL